jgi:hypothetical protein
MKKVIALSALLALGALGMACGDAERGKSDEHRYERREQRRERSTQRCFERDVQRECQRQPCGKRQR